MLFYHSQQPGLATCVLFIIIRYFSPATTVLPLQLGALSRDLELLNTVNVDELALLVALDLTLVCMGILFIFALNVKPL